MYQFNKRIVLFACFLIILVTNNAFALYENYYQGDISSQRINTIIPIKKIPIQIVNLKVIISNQILYSDVKCKYILKNTSNKKIKIIVAFPTYCHPTDNIFIYINDNEIKKYKKYLSPDYYSSGIIKSHKNPDFNLSHTDIEYTEFYYWEMIFNPKEKKNVICKYSINWNQEKEWDERKDYGYVKTFLDFNVSTLNYWKGKVKKAEFFIKLRKEEIAYINGMSNKKNKKFYFFINYKYKGGNNNNNIIYILKENWTPKDNLIFGYRSKWFY